MPILKKSKKTIRTPEPDNRSLRGCSFPTTETETRTFTDGERVCAKFPDGSVRPYLFTKIQDPHPFDNGVAMYSLRSIDGIAGITLQWKNVGKTKKALDVVMSSIAREKNLPEDIEKMLKKYGGKRKTRRRRSTRRS